jgi:hypothetical protein
VCGTASSAISGSLEPREKPKSDGAPQASLLHSVEVRRDVAAVGDVEVCELDEAPEPLLPGPPREPRRRSAVLPKRVVKPADGAEGRREDAVPTLASPLLEELRAWLALGIGALSRRGDAAVCERVRGAARCEPLPLACEAAAVEELLPLRHGSAAATDEVLPLRRGEASAAAGAPLWLPLPLLVLDGWRASSEPRWPVRKSSAAATAAAEPESGMRGQVEAAARVGAGAGTRSRQDETGRCEG